MAMLQVGRLVVAVVIFVVLVWVAILDRAPGFWLMRHARSGRMRVWW